MSRHFSWFDNWKHCELSCSCGWTGRIDPGRTETFRELVDFRCPNCDAILAIISFPTEADIEAAATRGHSEAREMMKTVLAVRRRREEFDRVKLREPDQLPDIDGSSLDFIWDLVSSFYVISYAGREVWREPAGWEDWHRYLEVEELFRRKYGPRLCSMKTTSAAHGNLCGDDIAAVSKIP